MTEEVNPRRDDDRSGREPDPEQKDNTVDWGRPETWPREIGGSRGPEPTRYGDWEHNGRCTDF